MRKVHVFFLFLLFMCIPVDAFAIEIDKDTRIIDEKIDLEEMGTFKLKGLSHFSIQNSEIKGQKGSILFTGIAHNMEFEGLEIKDLTFTEISGTEKEYTMALKDCTFENSKIFIHGEREGNIQIENCHFKNTGIYFYNANVKIKGSTFEDTPLTLKGKKEINIVVQGEDNTFIGEGMFYIHLLHENSMAKFHHNIIRKEKKDLSLKGGKNQDFQKNYWGDYEGPKYIKGEDVDYSNWALFEDFSFYEKDLRYEEKELKILLSAMEEEKKENKKYDFNEDERIDLLDVIYFTRKLE